MPDFDALLAELLEEPEEVLGILSDVVERGRLQADDLPAESVEILSGYDLVAFLITRKARRPMHTWVYPTPLGLRVYATLEREAERVAALEAQPQVRTGKRGNRTGVSR
ncbi:MAG: hypothetical protein QOE90_1809 [Thermoplasmata archaeon]|jgi:hypothetical protein|nr:hypothetical protein [Thermoplasmata archaeon]